MSTRRKIVRAIRYACVWVCASSSSLMDLGGEGSLCCEVKLGRSLCSITSTFVRGRSAIFAQALLMLGSAKSFARHKLTTMQPKHLMKKHAYILDKTQTPRYLSSPNNAKTFIQRRGKKKKKMQKRGSGKRYTARAHLPGCGRTMAWWSTRDPSTSSGDTTALSGSTTSTAFTSVSGLDSVDRCTYV